VGIPKARDGSLGLNVRESILLTSGAPVTRIVGYKAVASAPSTTGLPPVKVPGSAYPAGFEQGPAEILGYLQDSDIIVAVGSEDVTGLAFNAVIAKIKASPAEQVKLRMLRPEPYMRLRVGGLFRVSMVGWPYS
jgi:hypothetical protein